MRTTVALHRLRNIDVLSQGLYRVVCSVSLHDDDVPQEDYVAASLGSISSTGRRTATATTTESAPDPETDICTNNPYAGAHIDGGGTWGVSRLTYIRYRDQVDALEEMFNFEYHLPLCENDEDTENNGFAAKGKETDADAGIIKDTIIVHFDLYHLLKERIPKDGDSAALPLDKMSFVQRRSVALSYATLGHHTYLPVQFHDWYSCVVVATVHTSVVGFVIPEMPASRSGSALSLVHGYARHTLGVMRRLFDLVGVQPDDEDDAGTDEASSSPQNVHTPDGCVGGDPTQLVDLPPTPSINVGTSLNSGSVCQYDSQSLFSSSLLGVTLARRLARATADDRAVRWFSAQLWCPVIEESGITLSMPPSAGGANNTSSVSLTTLVDRLGTQWDFFVQCVLPATHAMMTVRLKNQFYAHVRHTVLRARSADCPDGLSVFRNDNAATLPRRGGDTKTMFLHILNDSRVPPLGHTLYRRSKHGIVLVHGFRGAGLDLRIVRRTLSLCCPHAVLHVATSITSKPYASLSDLAEALTQEVLRFLDEHALDRLSFVSHSMGGLVVRAAVQSRGLAHVRDRMHTLATMCCPHVGAARDPSDAATPQCTARNITTSVARTLLPNSSCLNALYLADGSLERLAAAPNEMDVFSNVLLVGCEGDTFVSVSSAVGLPPNAGATPTQRTISELIGKKLNYHNNNNRRVVQVVVPRAFTERYENGVTKFGVIDRVLEKRAHLAAICNPEVVLHIVLRYHEMFV